MLTERIVTELQLIRHRLDKIDKTVTQTFRDSTMPLPDHLRRTLNIVVSKGECNATEVATQTGRNRAVESAYLNQLTQSKWLKKTRRGKVLIFKVQLKLGMRFVEER